MASEPPVAENEPFVTISLQTFRSLLQIAELQIDLETAEVICMHARTLDTCGARPDLPEDSDQVGPGFFARSP